MAEKSDKEKEDLWRVHLLSTLGAQVMDHSSTVTMVNPWDSLHDNGYNSTGAMIRRLKYDVVLTADPSSFKKFTDVANTITMVQDMISAGRLKKRLDKSNKRDARKRLIQRAMGGVFPSKFHPNRIRKSKNYKKS